MDRGKTVYTPNYPAYSVTLYVLHKY